MGTLSFIATVSLDGYVEDTTGDFQWYEPSPEVFDLHVDRIASVSTEVLGRKTFELMRYWEELDPEAGEAEGVTAAEQVFARRWRGIDKVAVSSTLTPAAVLSSVPGPGRVSLAPHLELAELRRIVDAAPGVVEIFGPTTAAPAIRAGMVEDFHLFVVPKTVGGGRSALPDGARLDLALVGQRVFRDGVVYLHYASPHPKGASRD